MKQNTLQATGQRLDQKKGLFSYEAIKYLKKNWILYLFVLPTIVWYIVFRCLHGVYPL